VKVLYHLPLIPPKIPQAEALFQEIEMLRQEFQGDLLYVNPNDRSPIYLPRLLFGFHRLVEIRRRETQVDLHHFYNPDPFAFPYLRLLRRPVVYSIGGGIGNRRPDVGFLNAMGAVTVLDTSSATQLRTWGVRNVHKTQAGIDTARFSYTPQPLDGVFRVMMASAPWTLAQFESKGIHALLDAAEQSPNLHLILLWRGVLGQELIQQVQSRKLEKRVTVLDKLVDVNDVLATVHATVVLATHANLVKAYPHSLLDSLAAGKPILISRAIPMAEYVEKSGCGRVVEAVTPSAILDALQKLMADYPRHQATALKNGRHDFSHARMIESYRHIYAAAQTDIGATTP
jgi:glycosyltransferase involved in cell wall biosynthesis